MGEIVFFVLLFAAFVGGIWFSYRLFMRGDTNAERVASRLPPGFKADWSWRKGDTYVGYEKAGDRLAIVDYPHGVAVAASEVQSVKAMDERTLGIVHRWLVVSVPREPTHYRVWFQFSATNRDAILAKLQGHLPQLGIGSSRAL